MSATMNCPGCKTSLRIRDDMAGKKIKCPRCARVLTVPGPANEIDELPSADDIVTSPAPRRKSASSSGPRGRSRQAHIPPGKRPCPVCGEPIAPTARQCRHCHSALDDEDEDSGQRASRYEPCPRCGATGARRVMWTFWGSFYGPAMFTHVRCPSCGYTYNGRTGGSNLLPAIVFVTLPVMLILGLLGFVAWIFHAQGYF